MAGRDCCKIGIPPSTVSGPFGRAYERRLYGRRQPYKDHQLMPARICGDRLDLPVIGQPYVSGRINLDRGIAHQPVEHVPAFRGDGIAGIKSRGTVGRVGAA